MNLVCIISGHRKAHLITKTYIPTGSEWDVYMCKRCHKVIHKRKGKLR